MRMRLKLTEERLEGAFYTVARGLLPNSTLMPAPPTQKPQPERLTRWRQRNAESVKVVQRVNLGVRQQALRRLVKDGAVPRTVGMDTPARRGIGGLGTGCAPGI